MEITDKDRRRMNSKVLQFFRFVVLNLKILKGVDVSKRAWGATAGRVSGRPPWAGLRPRLAAGRLAPLPVL